LDIRAALTMGLPSSNLWRRKGVIGLAKNPPAGPGRRGAVKQRSQFQGPNGNWIKRDAETGRIMDQKADDAPLKGVRREK
jgi:hypothetical protein